ncbi:hypothetical protein [Natronorubrum tibetense]|uniref:Uncharacterized protein n=1 Tax=Natronorubrum tibetense GA33 TaxID=1114856 RepID=L9VW73_9EURY|nr:hypothetical protein [Natronorubrum tibetense]ELY41252.1 hypothetical protein C496_09711 [Natronorubrum tibetense GA33]
MPIASETAGKKVADRDGPMGDRSPSGATVQSNGSFASASDAIYDAFSRPLLEARFGSSTPAVSAP